MGARDVQAFRLSSELSYQISDTEQLMITPFYRHNRSELMPSWMLTYDPVLGETRFASYGILVVFEPTLRSH
ncbi:hypothetical protein [Alishewanella longhuensis]